MRFFRDLLASGSNDITVNINVLPTIVICRTIRLVKVTDRLKYTFDEFIEPAP